jgi:hypothetical protein
MIVTKVVLKSFSGLTWIIYCSLTKKKIFLVVSFQFFPVLWRSSRHNSPPPQGITKHSLRTGDLNYTGLYPLQRGGSQTNVRRHKNRISFLSQELSNFGAQSLSISSVNKNVASFISRMIILFSSLSLFVEIHLHSPWPPNTDFYLVNKICFITVYFLRWTRNRHGRVMTRKSFLLILALLIINREALAGRKPQVTKPPALQQWY